MMSTSTEDDYSAKVRLDVEESNPTEVPKPRVPPGFKAPEPKPFTVRSENALSIISASLGSALRGYSGVFVEGYSLKLKDGKVSEQSTSLPVTKPRLPLEVYEFEACPYCRKVREALCILDLEVYVYPCPKEGVRFRPLAIQAGGKKQFPYLVDPNTGFAAYESDDIVNYLFKTYGDGQVPLPLRGGLFTNLSSGLSSRFRPGKGTRRAGVKTVFPEYALELWSYEPSPFCKVVREKLCELELPYLLHNTPRGAASRQALKDRVGRFQVPYLEDANTGVKMFESVEIIKYLEDTYGPDAYGALSTVPEPLQMKVVKIPSE